MSNTSTMEYQAQADGGVIAGSVHTISPPIAMRLLANNTINRPVSKGHVDSLAKDMSAGRWRLNGETIIISKSGRILDGQHRLLAIIKSGVSIQTFVVTGVDEKDMESIGVGKKRSSGNILAMCGYSNANALGGVARQFALLEAGLPGAKLPVTPIEEKELIVKYPAIEDATVWLNGCTIARRSAIAACYAFLLVKGLRTGADTGPVHEFFEQLKSGAGMTTGSPVYALRSRLERIPRGGVKSNRDLIGLTLKAWMLHKRGARVTRLIMDGEVPEVEV